MDMCKALEDLCADARTEGLEQGIERGIEKQKIDLFCKKLRRGKSPGQIAEEMEEDAEVIRGFCKAAASFGPDYDSGEVYEAWKLG